jgi:hypothetical protein
MTPEQANELLTELEAIRETRVARLALLKKNLKSTPLLDLSDGPEELSTIDSNEHPTESAEEARLRAAIKNLDRDIEAQITGRASRFNLGMKETASKLASRMPDMGLKKVKESVSAAFSSNNPRINDLEGTLEHRKEIVNLLNQETRDLNDLESDYAQTTAIPLDAQLPPRTPARREEEILLVALAHIGDTFARLLNEKKIKRLKNIIEHQHVLLRSLDDAPINLVSLEDQYIKIDKQATLAKEEQPIPSNAEADNLLLQLSNLQLKLANKISLIRQKQLKPLISQRENLLILLDHKPVDLDSIQTQFEETRHYPLQTLTIKPTDERLKKKGEAREAKFTELGIIFEIKFSVLQEQQKQHQDEQARAQAKVEKAEQAKIQIEKQTRENMIEPREALLIALNNITNPMELDAIQDRRNPQDARELQDKDVSPKLKEQLSELNQQIDAKISELKKQQEPIIAKQEAAKLRVTIIRSMIEPREEFLMKLKHIQNPIEINHIQDRRDDMGPEVAQDLLQQTNDTALQDKVAQLNQEIDAEFKRQRATPPYLEHVHNTLNEQFKKPRITGQMNLLRHKKVMFANLALTPNTWRERDTLQRDIESLTKLEAKHRLFQPLQKRIEQREGYLQALETSNPMDYKSIADTDDMSPLPPQERPKNTAEGHMESALRERVEALDIQIEARRIALSKQPMAGGATPEKVKATIEKVEALFNNLNKHLQKIQGDLKVYQNKDPNAYQQGYNNAIYSLHNLQAALEEHKDEHIQSLKAPPKDMKKPVAYDVLEASCSKTLLHFVGEIRTAARKEMPQSRYKQLKLALKSLASWFNDSFKSLDSSSKEKELTPLTKTPLSDTYKAKVQTFIAEREGTENKHPNPKLRGN